MTFSLLPVDSMLFSVHYCIKNCIKCISASMHFYHSTDDSFRFFVWHWHSLALITLCVIIAELSAGYIMC